MKRFLSLLCSLAFFIFHHAEAQDPLPHITVKNFNGKVIISWLNEYRRTPKRINIQRSYDSLKDFSSIATMLNPENIDNGYLDPKPPYKVNYYRVFIVFEGGAYAFSEIKKAGTPETMQLTSGDSIALSVLKPANMQSGSLYIGRDNNIIIDLPDAELKKYSIKFYDEADKPVFEISKLHEPYLTLDKVNFIHAGWFYYEVYEKGKLVERNKFYVPKDQGSLPPGYNERGRKNR